MPIEYKELCTTICLDKDLTITGWETTPEDTKKHGKVVWLWVKQGGFSIEEYQDMLNNGLQLKDVQGVFIGANSPHQLNQIINVLRDLHRKFRQNKHCHYCKAPIDEDEHRCTMCGVNKCTT
jgi:uncharacterized protein with PIN domain